MCTSLSGCGTYVPPMQEAWEGKPKYANLSAGGVLEYNIKQKVYCGIVDAVAAVRAEHLLPRGWSVQSTLDLKVDETGSINPGVSIIDPMAASQSFTFGVGATLSSQGTREDTYSSYWNLDRLTGPTGNPCDPSKPPPHGSSPLLESDLGITEWLHDAMVGEYGLSSSDIVKDGNASFKQDSLSYHIKFVVISSGSATPAWKLTRVATGNGGLPLVDANRTRTHDLLLTFGPTFKAGTPNFALNLHAAQQYGIAISNGLQTVIRPFAAPSLIAP